MWKTTRLALLAILLASSARAQWIVDGVRVSNSGTVWEAPLGRSDGAGGMFVVWADNLGMGIYAQRLDADGTPKWTSGGVAVCSGVAAPQRPQLMGDGSGGFIVVWNDFRSGTSHIYAQRIDSNGTAQWAANGVVVCSAPGGQICVVTDLAGGVVVTWADYRAGSDIYAQRINGLGFALWPFNGVAICAETGAQDSPVIVNDTMGGLIIAWSDARAGDSFIDIYAKRVTYDGANLWSSGGVAVCVAANTQFTPLIASDGSGGAVIAWQDERVGGLEDDIYAQRMNSGGTPQWTANGVAVCTAAGYQALNRLTTIIPDGSGGAILTWEDSRAGFGISHVYAQRMSGNGVAQWAANGVGLCTTVGNHQSPMITADGAGGAIVSWHDSRSGPYYDVYAQRVSSSGGAQWTPDGVALCTAPGNEASTCIVRDGSGGAVVAWLDDRSGGNDVYAQRVLGDGSAVSFTVNSAAEGNATGTLWEAIAQANVIPGVQTISFNIPGPGPHLLDGETNVLPAITDALTIDGFTQPGASPNTNPVGSASNAQIKVEITGPSGYPGLVFQAPGTLRGVAISGFDAPVQVESPGVVIEGNYIGTNASGNQVGLHQQWIGVRVLGNACRIGGVLPAARNVIGNCYLSAIQIDGAANTQVYGNYIGVGADKVANIANRTGVQLIDDATGARIGSNSIGSSLYSWNPAESNLIMWNNWGVMIDGANSTGNLIIGNSMLWNSIATIDLGNDGVSPNDAGDVDTGPNRLQNHPDLTSAVGTQITGTMTGAPNQSLFLHFYWSPGCCTNAAHYMGGTTVTLNGSGTAPFTYSAAGPIPGGSLINATATDTNGNTSEVSFPVGYYNTPAGSPRLVTLMDLDGNMYGTATFSNVIGTGNTATTHPFSPTVPATGFSLANPNDPQNYFNVTTDASYTGGIDVCLNYDENNAPGYEANLVLLHYDGSMWVNVTMSRDLVNNKICGHVTSLGAFAIGAVITTAVNDHGLPGRFALHANVPNPFNPVTSVAYDVPAGGGDVHISIYDVAGRFVRELVHEHRPAGVFSVQWNGDDDRGQRVASGVYFYRMRAGGFAETRKMVLLK